MKLIKIIFLLFVISFSFAQNKIKKEILLNENKEVINLNQFNNKLKDKKYWYKISETDTTFTAKIVSREEEGILDSSKVESIKKEIENISKIKIDSTDIVIINFFLNPIKDPNGSCIDHYTSDGSYINFFKKKKNNHIKQVFITEKNYNYIKNKVYEDSENIIKENCFEDALPCGNYIIIYPDNSYKRKHGEYRQDLILNLLNK